jgi:4-hydroxy-tetrahydrodipicolinate synthase
LYNLPDFTNELAPTTVIDLLREQEFIVGIKDSSGQVEHLTGFATARNGDPWTLLVGDDRLLAQGLQAGWDGGISGVAGFCPELLLALYRSFVEGHPEETARLNGLLDELIDQLAPFPTPWGIRVGLAARGIDTGPLPLPLTATRKQQIATFTEWLPRWLGRTGLVGQRADASSGATRL